MAKNILATNQNNYFGLTNKNKTPTVSLSGVKPKVTVTPATVQNPNLMYSGSIKPLTQTTTNYGIQSPSYNSLLGQPYQVNGGLRQGNNPVMGTLYSKPTTQYSGATTFPGYTPAFGAEQQAYVASQKTTTPAPGSAGSINYDLSKGGGANGAGYNSSNYGKTTTTTPDTVAALAEQTGLDGGGYGYAETAQERADRLFKEEIDARNRALATGEIDPNQVYQDTLNQYQSQIDAINSIYNDQLTNSRLVNAPGYKSRLDQNRIGQVMGGLVASPMGEAQTVGIQQANNQEQASAEAIINDRRAVQLASIHGAIRKSQEDALNKKYEAQKEGSASAIAEINARPAEKKRRISDAVKLLVAGGHDVNKMTPEDIKSFTDGLDTSKGEFISAYKEELSSQQAEAAKLAKSNAVSQPSSVQEYEYAVAQGYDGSFNDYQNADANRKAKATGSATKEPKMSEWEYKTQGLQTLGGLMSQSLDQNGKLTPAQYTGYKSQFVNGGLGTAKEFDTNYQQHVYINPKDKQYKYTSSSYGLPAA